MKHLLLFPDMRPIKITLSKNKYLQLFWQKDKEQLIDLMTLRKFCPCASCQQDRLEWSNSYIPLFTSEQLSVAEINAVGSYGISITWKDGHKTGIYEFDYLHQLAAQ